MVLITDKFKVEYKGADIYEDEYEEDEFNNYIDEYDTSVFWDELVMRLARRDALE